MIKQSWQMLKNNLQQARVKKSLSSIKHQLGHLLYSCSYESLLRAYKDITLHLLYFLNLINLKGGGQLAGLLEECVKMLAVLLDSTEFLQYGHCFGLFGGVILKYEGLTRSKVQANKEQTMHRIQKNNESQYYRALRLSHFSAEELNFSRSEKINNFLQQTIKNEIVLQNPQCLCCSPVFLQGLQIQNSNPLISNIIQLGIKGSIDKLTLQRYVCSLCNRGGGVVLIGVERTEGVLRVAGVKFKNFQEIHQREQEIMVAIGSIRPECHYLIQRVIVHTNLARPENPINEFMRICFRIFILPLSLKKLTYLQYYKKGCKNTYEIYMMDPSSRVTKLEPESIYSTIHKTYRSKRSVSYRNSHENIICFNPYYEYSHNFKKQVSEGKISQADLMQSQKQQDREKGDQKIIPKDDLKYKYKSTTLLIVASKKSDRYVEIFSERLKINKKVFEMGKPYSQSFNEAGGRSVWLLSHEASFAELKNILSTCEKECAIKPGSIKMMSVTKMLRIESEKLADFNEKKLKNRLKQRFGKTFCESLDTEVQNEIEKQMKSLSFDDYSQAIYAFMVLEELQLRAHFVREGSKAEPNLSPEY